MNNDNIMKTVCENKNIKKQQPEDEAVVKGDAFCKMIENFDSIRKNCGSDWEAFAFIIAAEAKKRRKENGTEI